MYTYMETYALWLWQTMQEYIILYTPSSWSVAFSPSTLTVFSLSSIVSILVYLIIRQSSSWIHQRNIHNTLQQARNLKQKQYQDFQLWLADKRNVHSAPQQMDLVEMVHDTDTISQAIQQSRITAVSVLLHYYQSALTTHQAYNCVTEWMYELAYQRALYIDQLSIDDKKKLPLCGVPISFKDSINIVGYDTTNGVAQLVKQPCQQHAVIVQLLLDAGAIPFVKTNIPQTLLSFECVNPLYGRTLNPFNIKYTSGGSTGGEAVLLACQASIIGIGTDIGGSIRIPAHFSGICGIKPTARRLTAKGFKRSSPGQDNIVGAPGPMAKSVDDLAQLMRVWLNPKVMQLDAQVFFKPFNDQIYLSRSKLKIGYYINDGFIEASPACQRAVKLTVEQLQKRGHSVTLWNPPHVAEAIGLYYAIMSADNGQTIMNQVKGEKIEPMIMHMKRSVSLPNMVKKLLVFVAKCLKHHKAAALLSVTAQKPVQELYQLVAKLHALKDQQFCDWNAHGFDVIVCPAHALPAIPHNSFSQISFSAASTMLWNCYDFPAGVVPVTQVQPSDVFVSPAHDLLDRRVRAAYDPVQQTGLPLGVQIVSLPFQEEMVLRVMKEVSEYIPFSAKPPRVL